MGLVYGDTCKQITPLVINSSSHTLAFTCCIFSLGIPLVADTPISHHAVGKLSFMIH